MDCVSAWDYMWAYALGVKTGHLECYVRTKRGVTIYEVTGEKRVLNRKQFNDEFRKARFVTIK